MTINTDLTIVLKSSKQIFALGEYISIDIIYENNSDSNRIFRDPASTWEVMLEIMDLSDSSLQRFPFGKIISKTNSFGITSESREPADDITIKPKEGYTFYPSTCRDHINLFAPGVYILKVNDRSDDKSVKVSNEFRITIEASEKSFGMLLDICADESQSLDNREFAVLWLGKYYPEFMYVFANPTMEQKELNEKMIVKANAWWKVHGGTPEMKKRILLTNTQAGVAKENKK